MEVRININANKNSTNFFNLTAVIDNKQNAVGNKG